MGNNDLSGWNFGSKNLSDFSFYNANLANANFRHASVRNSSFGQANLSNANFRDAILTGSTFGAYTNLTGADFTGADIRGAAFGPEISPVQLYSTTSYQSGDLTGLTLGSNNPSAWNFASKNLTRASFSADVTNANFSTANLAGSMFYYANLTGANLRGANLSASELHYATLTNADFIGATITGANFNRDYSLGGTGISAAQLYSTDSYRRGELTGIGFVQNALRYANFADKNLEGSNFGQANLEHADFRQANLRNVNFSLARITDANFSQANLTNSNLKEATLWNTKFDGTIIQGADFSRANGFTAEMLYATTSYQSKNLQGVALGGNCTGYDFSGQNLTNASLGGATLTGANFTKANLTNAILGSLQGANLSGAIVRQASLGIVTQAQLYSTASYQLHDLFGVGLQASDVSNWNFADQNLASASFRGARVANTTFERAIVHGADFYDTTSRGFTFAQLSLTSSYQDHKLDGIKLGSNNLSGWNFAGQGLAEANFEGATLTGVNFAGATIRGINLAFSEDFTPSQLYSTASYQLHDLAGIIFSASNNFILNGRRGGMNYTGWNFAGQDLSNAVFIDATLTNANFVGSRIDKANLWGVTANGFTDSQFYSTATYLAGNFQGMDLSKNNFNGWNLAGKNLTNVKFYYSTLVGADLTGADTRGALDLVLNNVISVNTIHTSGDIIELDLTAGRTLEIRDYDGDPDYVWGPRPAISVHVDSYMCLDSSGTLRMLIEADAWDSSISFEPGIAVSLNGGLLELTFASDVDLATQIGRTIRIFDWTGVTPTGLFNVVSPYTWDLSHLYTTGEVTLLSAGLTPGDFDGDGDVDGADFVVWQTHFPTGSGGTWATGDADGDGDVDAADFIVWQTHFPTTSGSAVAVVPEPCAQWLGLLGGASLASIGRRRCVFNA